MYASQVIKKYTKKLIALALIHEGTKN